MYPGGVEVPYDGVDNDCSGGDLLDVDGDGFPGLSRADYAGDWPDSLPDDVDCADDPGVRADAASIHPGAPDTPYDGIDGDCGGDDDYDADGDGFGPAVLPDGSSTLAAREAYAQEWGLALEPGSFDDCDDDDASVHPGAVDTPYDGVDADCGFDDDYDADGDGWLPDEEVWAAAREAWIASAWGGTPPFGTQWGDCLDVAEDGLAPATIYPGADDAPYDGVDSDCAGDQDYDADADGHVRLGDEALARAFDERWDGVGGWQPGDCDDGDPQISPSGIDRLDDGVDSDCDGSDTAGLLLDAASWAGIGSVSIASTRRHLIIGASAGSRGGDGPGVVLQTHAIGQPTVVLDHEVLVAGTSVEPALALLGHPSELTVLWAFEDGPTVLRSARLSRSAGSWSVGLEEDAFFGLERVSVAALDAAVEPDGTVTAWACGPDGTIVLDTDGGKALDPAALDRDTVGWTCFVEPGLPSEGVVCGLEGCRSVVHDPVWATIEPAVEQPWRERSPVDARHRGEQVVLAEPGIGGSIIGPEESWLVFPDESVSVLDGFVVDELLAAVAIIDEPEGLAVRALVGAPDAPSLLTLDAGEREPLSVAVQAIPEHDLVVFAMTLAGSGPGDDRLAWMVVGL